VRHIEEVVRKVQVAAEIEQGVIKFHPAAVDIRELVGDAILQLGAEGKINVDLTALPDNILGNADMLLQVVTNLLSNAIKYSSGGAEIAVVGLCQGDAAVLSVSDSGRGIPEDEQERIFEPYFRASNSRGVHGTGLGLYVVGRYIASHGGTIDIRSALHVGTTVTVRIPVGRSPQGADRATAPHPVY
jgi:signal transduction histidine kinase